eukprot:scaffold43798_cov49-Phaeocystis_antarctica.AAC.1
MHNDQQKRRYMNDRPPHDGRLPPYMNDRHDHTACSTYILTQNRPTHAAERALSPSPRERTNA